MHVTFSHARYLFFFMGLCTHKLHNAHNSPLLLAREYTSVRDYMVDYKGVHACSD